MSGTLTEDVLSDIKDLIVVTSCFKEGTQPFNHILKNFTTTLKKADTMYFLNKRDVDQTISSMREKFCFHGFFSQSEALNASYKTILPEILPKSETNNRLNIVKFLLCMSESPTTHFIEHPEMPVRQNVEPEKEVDWAAYLNEGIERWNPNFDDSSDEESFNSTDGDANKDMLRSDSNLVISNQIRSSERVCIMDFKINREELLATVQHSWFNQENFFMQPESDWREANIGILWENHLREQVQGLTPLRSPSIISEYKVIREIIWQLWCPHTSSTFELRRDNKRPRPDVTLASVRSYAFYNFMGEFVPYIELLDFFREFQRSLQCDLENDCSKICRTYQGYGNGLTSILHPVYKKLCDIEEEVRQQEKTYTLLKVAHDLNKIFEPVKLLKEIHDELILDYNTKTPLECATDLLIKLHSGLDFTLNKLERDLKISLFFESIYHYFGLVDRWLIKDDFSDYTGEFVIEKKNTTEPWQTQFAIHNLDQKCKQNSFMRIFLENVLKIGKNMHFLRFLKKYDIIGDCQESVYEEFIRKALNKLKELCNVRDIDESECDKENELVIEQRFIFPVLGTEIPMTNPEFQKLENLVDTEDGFLMTAFADFFTKKPPKKHREKISLYDQISRITENPFPTTHIFESIFLNILEERFTNSGLMVKNILIEEHLLEKQFQFLKHLYLFSDDMIYPFYRKLFEHAETSNKNWAKDIWLTSHLQDIFTDVYPEFYDKCSVQNKDGWSRCTDSLSVCSLVNINYRIPCPLNVIIRQETIEMYKEIFQFLLKLKWALHTLNHLIFSDLERNSDPKKKSQTTFTVSHHENKTSAKLVRLKFCLINILNSLQHFVFGFVFSKNLLKFELDFEKAYDLNSLIESHEEYINSVSRTVIGLKEKMLEKDKDNNVMNCVELLKLMWNNLSYATPERIQHCNRMYQQFYSDISPVIFPIYVYDY